MARPLVVIGMLGPTLDNGDGARRWTRWRPTVALCQDPELVVSRFELLFDPKFTSLAQVVADDLVQVSPETKVNQVRMPLRDPWDFEEVYGALHDFARNYDFRPDREDYLVHITTGTHVAQICLFLLAESRHLPGRLIQTGPPNKRAPRPPGTRTIIDLDLSKYDRLASRFQVETTEARSFLKQGIATKNAAYNALIDEMEHVALRTRAPMLLLGPTGAGKSELARRLFQLKHARNLVSGELVHVNCATLRGDHAMATLFGHTKGAFTGAASAREGLLLRANQGVLFLDRLGSWGSMSRRCCCARSRRRSSSPSAPTARCRATSCCSRAPTATCLLPSARASSALTCLRASTCGRSRCRVSPRDRKMCRPTSTTRPNGLASRSAGR